MATAAQRKKSNLRRSLQKAIKDRVETPNIDPLGRDYKANWINYDAAFFENTAHDYFAEVLIINQGAGNFGAMMVQINCFARESADEFGIELEEMIDLFEDAMRSSAGRIQIYDFSTPASPTEIAGRYLVPQNSVGKFGEPEGGAVNIDPPDGCRGKALTYMLKIHPDDYVPDIERYRPSV